MKRAYTPSAPHPPLLSTLSQAPTDGDSVFQVLLVSLAALISPMNSQLFLFVQLNPGIFMTVYHGGCLA